MRKIALLLMCALFAFGLVACEQRKEAASPAAGDVKEGTAQPTASAADAAEQAAAEERRKAAEMIGESSVEGAHH